MRYGHPKVPCGGLTTARISLVCQVTADAPTSAGSVGFQLASVKSPLQEGRPVKGSVNGMSQETLSDEFSAPPLHPADGAPDRLARVPLFGRSLTQC